MSLPFPFAAKPLKDRAKHLAWQHCWLHWRMGMILLVASTLAGFVLAPLFRLEAPTGLLAAAGTLLALCIFLGTSAAVFGLLRVPLMQWLFKRALRRPPAGRTGLLLGTGLIFLAPIVPLYLFLLFTADDTSKISAGFGLLFLVGPSLPWLFGSVGATWKLRTQWQTIAPAE